MTIVSQHNYIQKDHVTAATAIMQLTVSPLPSRVAVCHWLSVAATSMVSILCLVRSSTQTLTASASACVIEGWWPVRTDPAKDSKNVECGRE